MLAQRATAESYEIPQFIDCGENLKSICRTEMELERWQI